MERSNPKKRTTYSRRDFLKGVGGGAIGVGVGTTIMTATARGFRAERKKNVMIIQHRGCMS
jgi:DNA-binding transcriptional regulator LsrR (DeoR family)